MRKIVTASAAERWIGYSYVKPDKIRDNILPFPSRWTIEWFQGEVRTKTNLRAKISALCRTKRKVTILRSRKRRFRWTASWAFGLGQVLKDRREYLQRRWRATEEDVREDDRPASASENGNGCIYAGCLSILKPGEQRMDFLFSLSTVEDPYVRSLSLSLTN